MKISSLSFQTCVYSRFSINYNRTTQTKDFVEKQNITQIHCWWNKIHVLINLVFRATFVVDFVLYKIMGLDSSTISCIDLIFSIDQKFSWLTIQSFT